MAPLEDTSGKLELTVLCWNVLAHIHTHRDTELHTGEASSSGSEICLETPAQMRARHVKIVSAIARHAADVAILQEVDSHFMPIDWQGWKGPLPCGEWLEGYTPYRSYSERGEGTVVLLRDATVKRDTSVRTAYLAATEGHGWKTGVVLQAQRVGHPQRPFVVGTVHLRWGSPEQAGALLRSALSSRDPRVPMILGGDFNTPVTNLEALDALLRGHQLMRLATPAGTPTGMHSNETIDHVYASPCFQSRVAVVGPLPSQSARGPWGTAPELGSHDGSDHDGSDHAWIRVELHGL